MNRKNLFLNVVCIVLLLAHTFAYAKFKTINFAIEVPNAPFAILKDRGQFYGFDVDIAKAICKKLNAQYTFSTDKMTNLIPSLKTKKYDAWINTITITEERKKEIAFSNPYFSTTAKLIAKKDSTFNARPIELAGKTIGVDAGTIYVPYLKKTYGDTIKIITFPLENEHYSILTMQAFTALQNGKVDAVISDEILLKHWRAEQEQGGKNYRLIDLPAKHLDVIRQECGIAVAKDNLELLKEINRALAEIKADGTYNTIKNKYL